MPEYEIYELLSKYGIRTPYYKVFPIDKSLYFDKFPAVLKISSKKVSHKSEVGGVRVGIDSNEELKRAKYEMVKNLQKNGIFLDSEDRFIVEESLKGTEFYIGGIYDNIFEEVLLFGQGGIFIEIQQDICYIDTEAEEDEILKSISKTKISALLKGYRNISIDKDELLRTIKAFQNFFKNEDITEFDVNPLVYTEEGFIAVDARIKEGKKRKPLTRRSRHDLFENNKVAIIGASNHKNSVGYAIAKNALLSYCDIYFVNPKLDKLFGKKVYKNVEELEDIDTALIAVPAESVADIAEKLALKGVKNIVVISAGFKESGNIQEENRLQEIAKRYHINIVGPNSLGIYNSQKSLNLTFTAQTVIPGRIGLISQSGAVLSALVDKASAHSIGFSHIISLGNMADFDFADAIEALQKSPECSHINIYAEGLKDGKEFLRKIRKSKKPIYVYKSAKSKEAKQAAFTHTGNISGEYEMVLGLCEAAGASIKQDIDELIFAPDFQSFEEVLIISNAGGPATILTDIVVSSKKRLYVLSDEEIKKLNEVLPPMWSKKNPVDILGDATSKRYEKTLEILYKRSLLIFVVVTPQFMTDSLNIAKILPKSKNIIPIFFGEQSFKETFEYFRSNSILFFNDLENVKNIL